MGTVQAGASKEAALRDLAHDFRSALSATQAYLDLARERAAQGERLGEEDLARIERGLALLQAALAKLEAQAREARP